MKQPRTTSYTKKFLHSKRSRQMRECPSSISDTSGNDPAKAFECFARPPVAESRNTARVTLNTDAESVGSGICPYLFYRFLPMSPSQLLTSPFLVRFWERVTQKPSDTSRTGGSSTEDRVRNAWISRNTLGRPGRRGGERKSERMVTDRASYQGS